MTKSDEMKKQEGEQIQLHRHKGIREIHKGEEQTAYFERLQKMKLRHPVLIGFGISDKKSFDRANKYAAGAIIGSAYIKALKNSDDIDRETVVFVSSILN